MSNGGKPTGTGDGLTGLVQRNPGRTLTLLVLLGIGLLAMIVGPLLMEESTLLDNLADVEYARGVITFIFAVGTIGIAIILTIAALLGDPQAAERFNRGKEVFTILVGIFGTIIGFYFGTVQAKGEVEGKALEVARLAASVEGTGAERTLAIEADVEGGSPGYGYAFRFEPETAAAAIADGESADGKVAVSTPLGADAVGKVTVRIEVADQEGDKAARATEVEVPPTGAAVPR